MSIAQHIRQAVRLLSRSPAVSCVALLSIAITTGATAVVFTAVKAVLIDPLPYANPAALVQLRTDFQRGARPHADWVSWADMQDVRRLTRTFESIGTHHYSLFNLTGDASHPPEALYGLSVSAGLFPMLGASPMLGRNILPDEDQPGRGQVIILSYGLWKRRFNSDRNVVGQSVEVNGHPVAIIGVMPPAFDFPMRLATTVKTPSQHMDFWAPEAIDAAKVGRSSGYGAVARLKPGVTLAQAEADLQSISAELQRLYPATNRGRTLHLASLESRTFGFARTGLLLLMGAALLFMLIGCANVANLMLARALSRHREIAIRLALGAGSGRILRQLITESCVLAVAGGLAGYALTALAWTLLPSVAPMTIPRLAAARADWTVLAFTLAVSIVNGILFGIAPALRSSSRDPAASLRESASRGSVGTAHNALRSALVVSEVAVAVTLVIVGGLLTAGFVRLLATDPGFETNRVLASIIIPSGDQYQTPQSRALLFRKIVDAVRILPGVESAGTVDALPFSGENNGGAISADGAPVPRLGEGEIAEIDHASAGYLETLGIPLLEGRWFNDDDMDSARDTAVVNDIAARRLFAGQSALGKRFCINCANERLRQWKRVIGVVRTIRHASLDDPAHSEVYSASDAYRYADFLVVRSNRPAPEMTKAVRMAVASVDPKQPVFLSSTMSGLIGDSVADRRFIMTLLAITGCLALLLAAAGIYGVISYTTSQRTQEIGVRMALGASPWQVLALVFRQGMLLAGLGAVIGLACALVLTRLLRNALAGLASNDPSLIALTVALVILTASIACWIPARRATRVDPMHALRQD